MLVCNGARSFALTLLEHHGGLAECVVGLTDFVDWFSFSFLSEQKNKKTQKHVFYQKF